MDEGLELTTTYYYKVAAESECETSAQSNYAVATTGCMAKPAQAPANIRAEALSSTDIKISWDAVSDAGVASKYNVYTSESQNGYYRKIANTPGNFTSATISGHEPSTTYFFKISAENDCGESDLSTSYAYVTTGGCDLPIPPSPTGISATTASARRVSITWNEVNGASEYIVFRGTARYGSYSGIGGRITNTSFIDSTASPLTTYYYTVKSVNSCGGMVEDLDGDVVSVTTLCESPIPTNVEVTAKSSGSLEVKWDAVSGAVSYSVYRAARNPNGNYTLLGKVSGTNTTYMDTGLESLTSYYYKVTAKTEVCDDSGLSAYAAGTTQ
jgi:fibronectin type 3 domain-containing protein